MTLGEVLVFAVQAFVIFVVASFLFDALHWLLHRWENSRFALLRRLADWHEVHHRFLDQRMRIHPDLIRANLLYHTVPEYLTTMAGILLFLLFFPWPPVAFMAVVRTWLLWSTVRQDGKDVNHMAMDRIDGRKSLYWVNPSYHALHHVYPDQYFATFTNVFDLLFGTGAQFTGRRFLVTGGSGAFGSALVRRLTAMGALVETAKSRVDYAPGDYDRLRDKLARADVLVLAHGAKTDDCWNANYRTFVDLIERFREAGRGRLVPPEVWALGSEAEFHGDLGMASMRDYAASKRAFAAKARDYYLSPDLFYRHIVPAGFRSVMGGGLISAETAVTIALFFIRRGFAYVPVTYTTLAYWNYFRFRFLPRRAGKAALST